MPDYDGSVSPLTRLPGTQPSLLLLASYADETLFSRCVFGDASERDRILKVSARATGSKLQMQDRLLKSTFTEFKTSFLDSIDAEKLI